MLIYTNLKIFFLPHQKTILGVRKFNAELMNFKNNPYKLLSALRNLSGLFTR